MTLYEQIMVTQRARVLVATLAAELQAAQDQFAADHGQLIDGLDAARKQCAVEEGILRSQTVQAYLETGEKNFAGTGIRIITKLDYDLVQAFAWAKEHGICLKLDVATFEKIAKVTETRPAFVTVREEPQATIAADLRKSIVEGWDD